MNMLVRATMLATAALAAPFPSNAQDAETDGTAADTASHATDARQTDEAPHWTIATSTGISNRDNGPNGSWQAISLTRQIGQLYVRGTVMRYHGTLQQADTALPSDYLIGTIAAGGNFEGWVTDAWISYGRQDYGDISTSQGNRPSTGATGSPYFAIGGDFGKIIPLGSGWYLTPTVNASYAKGRLLRPAPTGTGLTDLETEEPTWSASTAVRLDHAFGGNKQNYGGISLSRNWSSNALSTVVLPQLSEGFAEPDSLESRHYADAWFEITATANMAMTNCTYIDLFASRSFNQISGNTTSAGITVRVNI
ncbi:autotransporter domain-containing protein [Novosphingobium malaysiense]|uniref:Autotransporter domain-containing protein n=1 Tax=Novosphingobium malaysiense TaxID=1348853 RepID=A0A0B1ZQD4_9SPHN|nr:autotransporter domain-containing protein [Novosphingobium malaysiense]KHK91474.1 hypothetical protein LK12_11625 [Novosphingobium malaysiense]